MLRRFTYLLWSSGRILVLLLIYCEVLRESMEFIYPPRGSIDQGVHSPQGSHYLSWGSNGNLGGSCHYPRVPRGAWGFVYIPRGSHGGQKVHKPSVRFYVSLQDFISEPHVRYVCVCITLRLS